MIISRTPFRVSFVGGGTDLPSFYRQEAGAVISVAINQYVFITVHRRFDGTIRVSYSETEITDSLDKVRHPLFREALRQGGVVSGLEVTSVADVPAGTGLGSSSSFAVGLLQALHAYQGRHRTASQLAEEACHVEIDVLGEPIGKQDQYAAAFGGLRHYQFNPDGSVYVDPVICSGETKARLLECLMFFYLGGTRSARQVLEQQARNTSCNMDHLRRLRALVDSFWTVLTEGRDILRVGELLHDAWQLKKQLASNITNGEIDKWYERARRAGALGGKLLGAGSGGFLMLFCEAARQPAVREALRGLREVDFKFEPEGSKIIYVGE